MTLPSYLLDKNNQTELRLAYVRRMSNRDPLAGMKLLPPHPNQQTIVDSDARYRVVACGRRFGKTEIGIQTCLTLAAQGKRVWWLSPTYPMSSDVWRNLSNTTRNMVNVTANKSERIIEFENGGFVTVKSTHNPDNLRGAGLDFVVLDEAAFMLPNVWPEIVRPMLLDRKGGAMFLSTPFGLNWFFNLYGIALREPEWEAFHFTSYDAPHNDHDELAQIRRNTPERVFKQEYLAEFLEDRGVVFRNVKGAVVADMPTTSQDKTDYVFGVDWGKENDYTVIAVLDATNNRIVHIERFNQIGWHLQRGRLVALYEQWQPFNIIAENNSIGSPNIEELQREGLPMQAFQTTAQSKTPLIEQLALAIEQQTIGLVDDPVLIQELMAYQIERLPSGTYRYNAPPGSHDDTVIATALAWSGRYASNVGSFKWM